MADFASVETFLDLAALNMLAEEEALAMLLAAVYVYCEN